MIAEDNKKTIDMKRRIIVLLTTALFFIQIACFAQNLFIEVKQEILLSEKFKLKGQNNEELGVLTNTSNFSISLSGQIYKRLYLRTSLGSSDFDDSMNVEWTSFGDERRIAGRIRITQNFIELHPEFRFCKEMFYVNLGGGFSSVRDYEFIYGGYWVTTGSSSSRTTIKENSTHFFRRNFIYLAGGLGASFIPFEEVGIGLSFDLAFRTSAFAREGNYPGLGFEQFVLKFGISYALK